jgi:hypothetical protein
MYNINRFEMENTPEISKENMEVYNDDIWPKTNDSLDVFLLNIMIETNIQDTPELLTMNKLVIPEKDEQEQSQRLSLNDIPFFTYKYKYPLTLLRKIGNYKDRVNIFFNQGEFNRVMSKGEEILIFNNEEEMTSLLEENMMIMLEILFPTKFPIIDNLHKSSDYLSLSSSYRPLSFDKTKYELFSHLKINNKEHTIEKVTLYNDIINHPLYYQLIYKTYLFQNWANSNKHALLLQEPKQSLLMDEKYKNKFPLEYLNYENSTLLEYKYPNRVINNVEFQELITNHESMVSNKNYTKDFHNMIKYLYKRYFQGHEITETDSISNKDIERFEQILKTNSLLCDINMKKSGIPTKEVYIRMNLHEEKIDDSNVDSIKCKYYGEAAGEQLHKLMIGVPTKSYFVNPGMASSNNDSSSFINKDDVNKSTNKKINYMEEIEKINNVFVDHLKNTWQDAKGALTIDKKLFEILNKMKKNILDVQDKKYQVFKTINYDTRSIVEYILKDKYLPENINNVKMNQSMSIILNNWAKQIKKPYEYEKLTELLIDIDDYINRLNSIRSKNKIMLNNMERKNDPNYLKYNILYKYQNEVLSLYEFILIYVVYNSLVKVYLDDSNYNVPKNKYSKSKTTGGKRTRRNKNKNSRHKRTMKK